MELALKHCGSLWERWSDGVFSEEQVVREEVGSRTAVGPSPPKSVFPLSGLSLRPALGPKPLPSCLRTDASPTAAVRLSVDQSSMNSHFLSGAAPGVFISASASLLSGSSFSQVLVRGGRA